MTWNEYHSLDDMNSFFEYLERNFSSFVSTEIIGQSYEGRDMKVVKVCKGGCGNKKAVWIDGGIHARYDIFRKFFKKIPYWTSLESGLHQL